MQTRLQFLALWIVLLRPAVGAAECDVGKITSRADGADAIKELENRWISSLIF